MGSWDRVFRFSAKIIVSNENLQPYLKQNEGQYIIDDGIFKNLIPGLIEGTDNSNLSNSNTSNSLS